MSCEVRCADRRTSKAWEPGYGPGRCDKARHGVLATALSKNKTLALKVVHAVSAVAMTANAGGEDSHVL